MGDNSDGERELLAAADVDTDSEWGYEEEEITEDSNSCNFYNEEQPLENRSDATDTDVEDDGPPVIQHPTPMAMIENGIDVSLNFDQALSEVNLVFEFVGVQMLVLFVVLG